MGQRANKAEVDVHLAAQYDMEGAVWPSWWKCVVSLLAALYPIDQVRAGERTNIIGNVVLIPRTSHVKHQLFPGSLFCLLRAP